MLIYETPNTWIPDSVYVNSATGLEYLAWQIGRDDRRNKSLWLIAPVVASPTQDLEDDILPVGYTSQEFTDDVLRYGHIRSTLTGMSVIQLEAAFLQEIDDVTQAIIDGYR